jgi:hypothetical protein
MSVRGDKVESPLNHRVAASYDESALVTAGKLKSTDAPYAVSTTCVSGWD